MIIELTYAICNREEEIEPVMETIWQDACRIYPALKEGDRFELEPYQRSAKAMEEYFKDDGFFQVLSAKIG